MVVGRMGVYYRFHEGEDVFILDVDGYEDDELQGFRHGYCWTIVRKGHVHCCCMRSIRLRYFKYHVNRTDNEWPMDAPGTLVNATELATMLGDEFRAYDCEFCLIRVSPNRTLANRPPWLVPARISEVVTVAESDSDSSPLPPGERFTP